MRISGTVKWFNDAKGFGFLGRDDGGEDVFVHYSGISGKGHRTLEADDTVEFEIGQSERGRTQAVNVSKVAAAARV